MGDGNWMEIGAGRCVKINFHMGHILKIMQTINIFGIYKRTLFRKYKYALKPLILTTKWGV